MENFPKNLRISECQNSLWRTSRTSASSWRPSWSLSRVSRDCWMYLMFINHLSYEKVERPWLQILCAGDIIFDRFFKTNQPPPLKILHQLHNRNAVQLNALKTLVEPAMKKFRAGLRWSCTLWGCSDVPPLDERPRLQVRRPFRSGPRLSRTSRNGKIEIWVCPDYSKVKMR